MRSEKHDQEFTEIWRCLARLSTATPKWFCASRKLEVARKDAQGMLI